MRTTEESRLSQRETRRWLRKSAAGLCALTLAGLAAVWPPSPLPMTLTANSLRMAASARPKPIVFSPHQPLRFEENVGQTDRRADFLARGLGHTLFLTRQGAVLELRSRPSLPESGIRGQLRRAKTTDHRPRTTDVVRLRLVGANAGSGVEGEEELGGKSNYFIGKDAGQWRRGVRNYRRVKYGEVYRGVDVEYYGRGGRLEYDWVVHAGADPGVIELGVERWDGRLESGKTGVVIDANGDCRVRAGAGEVILRRPVAYQEEKGKGDRRQESERNRWGLRGEGSASGEARPGKSDLGQPPIRDRQYVEARYVRVGEDGIAIAVGRYDHSRDLTIDPVLDYSSYIGGSGGDLALGIAVDSANNAYVMGMTGSTNFPITSAEQATLGGSTNAFVTKFNPAGALVYSTYLGGEGSDAGTGIAVDASGTVTIVGNTTSSNFPTSSGAFQTTYAGAGDAFVARLSETGTTLVYSTYLGGTGGDFGQGVALDVGGNAYVTGSTESTDFPVAMPLQIGLNGPSDVFVSKLNPTGTALIYSTYLGGSGGESGQGIAVDSSGDAYVAGFTASTDFPTQSAFQSSSGGGTDAFALEFSPDGSKLIFSTYLGGSGQDRAFGIALDSVGSIYITGDSQSLNFPVTTGAFQLVNSGNGDAFVSKFAPGGTSLVYSTLLGGTGPDQATGIAVDALGQAALTGFTQSSDFPVVDPFQKIPGISGAGTCGTALCSDAFVGLFGPSGNVLYSTYLGGSANDFGQGVAVDSSGGVYVAGGTASQNFPVIAGAAEGAYAGVGNSGNAFVAKVNNVDAPAVALTPQQINFGSQALRTPSDPKSVSLINEGSAPLGISSIKATGDFSQINNCGTVVPAGGGACSIQITFNPIATGTVTDQIAITDNAGGSPQIITVTGAGISTAGFVTVSPLSLTFPPTLVGSTSSAQTVRVTNTGNAAIELTNILPTAGFTETNTCGTLPAVLNVSGSCAIGVTFSPAKTGSASGTLTITDSAGGSHAVTLAGSGSPQFSLSASATSTVLLIGTTSTTFTISASAPSSFLTAIALSCSSVGGGAACGFNPSTVNAGQSSTLTVNQLSATSPNPLNITVAGTAGAQAANVTLNVFFSDFSLTAIPKVNSVSAGQSINYTVTVTPTNGFDRVVLLDCATVPQNTTCTWSPPGLTLNGSAALTATLTVQTTSQTSSAWLWRAWERLRNGPWPGGPWILWVGAWLAVLAFLGKLRVVRAEAGRLRARLAPQLPLLAWAVLLSLLLLELGCQTYYNGLNVTPAPIGTPSGNYTIVLRGTLGSNASVTRITAVNLSVGPG